MKLDINQIYHNHIVRVVIFSIFLYKPIIKQQNAFKQSVISFTKRRLPWDIGLSIDMGVRLDKEDERDIILQEILDNIENDYLNIITACFKTPLKDVILEIDMKKEDKYQQFLYQ